MIALSCKSAIQWVVDIVDKKFQADPCRNGSCSGNLVQGIGGRGESELDTAYILAWNNLYIIYVCCSALGTQGDVASRLLKQNIVRFYSELKLNVPTRNCIGSLRSQDLCKWYHNNCGLVMHSSKVLLMAY